MNVAVPIVIDQLLTIGKEDILKSLKSFDAEEVLIFTPMHYHEKHFSLLLEKIKEASVFFAKHNITTSLWTESLRAFGSENYEIMKSITEERSSLTCPLDEKYVKDYCKLFSKMLKSTNAKKVFLEDNFRMQMVYEKANCFCPKHMKLYSEILGEDMSLETMKKYVLNGEPNKYRDAWFEGCKKALENFAKEIRKTADDIDKSIEIVLCCGTSLFGADGTNAVNMADIFATETNKPSLRLIGAPYWEEGHHIVKNMMTVMDFTRHQAHELKKHGIKTYGECDPHYRPRFYCSAASVEFFHTICLADGNFDKILKYGADYVSSSRFETGYAKFHQKNKDTYKTISKLFKGKTPVGFYQYEPFDRIKYAHKVSEVPEHAMMETPLRSFMCNNSMPAVFEPGEVNVVMGENARSFPENLLKNGNIIDIDAALILREKGVDVGIENFDIISYKPCHTSLTNAEYYHAYNDYQGFGYYRTPKNIYRLKLQPGANTESEFLGDEKYVASYTYENKFGEKFLVYNFSMDEAYTINGMTAGYYRQMQIFDLHEWLSGKKFDAVCIGNPYLYMIVKKDEHSMTIGLWNYFRDAVIEPEIELADTFKSAKFVNCNGQLSGNKIHLTDKIGAYEFCFIELEK